MITFRSDRHIHLKVFNIHFKVNISLGCGLEAWRHLINQQGVYAIFHIVFLLIFLFFYLLVKRCFALSDLFFQSKMAIINILSFGASVAFLLLFRGQLLLAFNAVPYRTVFLVTVLVLQE